MVEKLVLSYPVHPIYAAQTPLFRDPRGLKLIDGFFPPPTKVMSADWSLRIGVCILCVSSLRPTRSISRAGWMRTARLLPSASTAIKLATTMSCSMQELLNLSPELLLAGTAILLNCITGCLKQRITSGPARHRPAQYRPKCPKALRYGNSSLQISIFCIPFHFVCALLYFCFTPTLFSLFVTHLGTCPTPRAYNYFHNCILLP